MALPEGWEPRHVEAYTAWKQGDQNRLIEACVPEIRKLAYKLASTSRRRGSDELRQPSRFDRFEEGRKREAALGQAGLREAKEVADFEELYSAGCQAVLEAKGRYDLGTGTPFQAFAYKRIRGAMIDLLNEKRKQGPEQAHDSSQIKPAKAIERLVALVREGERDDSVLIGGMALFLERMDLEDWYGYIQSADFKVVRFFWGFLYQFADELDSKIGDKRLAMLYITTTRYWYLVFKHLAQRKTPQPVDISGPQHMEIIERRRKALGVRPAKVDDKQMGRMLRPDKKPIDGKTIARWREDMAEAGPPPFMREDGLFTLKSQEEWDAFTEYFLRINDPRAGRRLQRRRQQDSQ
jgi:sigma-70-like protein